MRKRAPNGAPVKWLKDHATYTGDDCLPWPFGMKPNGYGSVQVGTKWMNAHRAMCLMAHGEPAAGETDVAHSCGNRACCNPRHLRHATRKANERDKLRHGTSARGTNNGHAILTEDAVRAIRESVASGRMLSEHYGVAQETISAIRHRKIWAWLH